MEKALTQAILEACSDKFDTAEQKAAGNRLVGELFKPRMRHSIDCGWFQIVDGSGWEEKLREWVSRK